MITKFVPVRVQLNGGLTLPVLQIPWSLRDLIADDRVAHFFAREFAQLKDAFDEWSPKTSILRDIKRKLQPIQRLSSIKTIQLGSRL